MAGSEASAERITVVVIRSAAKTAMSHAQTSSKTSLVMQVRKLSMDVLNFQHF
jgi:hypothetical protein